MGLIATRQRRGEVEKTAGRHTGSFPELLRRALVDGDGGVLVSGGAPEIGLLFADSALRACWTGEPSLGLPATLGRYGLLGRASMDAAWQRAGRSASALPAVLQREGLLGGLQIAAGLALFAGDLLLVALRHARAPWVWTTQVPEDADRVPVGFGRNVSLDMTIESCRRLWDPDTAIACLGGERELVLNDDVAGDVRARFGEVDRAALAGLACARLGSWLAEGDAWDRSGTLLAAYCVGLVGPATRRGRWRGLRSVAAQRRSDALVAGARRHRDRGAHLLARDALREALRACPEHRVAREELRSLPAPEAVGGTSHTP